VTASHKWIGAASSPDVWRSALERLPAGQRDVYFEPEYALLYESANGQAECFIYEDGGDLLVYPFMRNEVPAFPGRFDLCTPYGYGGPLASTRHPEFLRGAFAAFHQQARQRGVIAELIKCHPLLGNHARLAEGGFPGKIVPVCKTVFVPMAVDEEARFAQIYTHANRKNINKSRRANAVFTTGPELWSAFLPLYEGTMTANQAASFYFFPATYFERLQQTMPAQHTVVGVTVDGQVAAAMVVLHGQRFAYCHLIGTRREMMGLGVNNFLHHELIQWCKGRGLEALLIGGGRSNDDDDSLLNFKKNFSDQLAQFYVAEHVLDRPRYDEVRAAWAQRNPGKEASSRLLSYRL
jgi:hypothetical protein